MRHVGFVSLPLSTIFALDGLVFSPLPRPIKTIGTHPLYVDEMDTDVNDVTTASPNLPRLRTSSRFSVACPVSALTSPLKSTPAPAWAPRSRSQCSCCRYCLASRNHVYLHLHKSGRAQV
ncbi:hypothetical protein C8J57DRAFT_1729848, partial [Mycena rebaudengoi]